MSAQAEAVAKLRESHTLGGRSVMVRGQLTFLPARLQWCDDHAEAWAWMCDCAREFVKAGEPFGMRLLMELARYEFRVRRADRDAYSVNNNLQRALGQRLRAEVPGADRLMRERGAS